HPAPGEAGGQRMVDHGRRLEPAERSVGTGGDAADAAVGLVAPVIEAGALGEVVGLVGETRAQAAGVGFLQAHDVVRAGELRDLVQRAALVAAGQHVRPAPGDVVAIAAGTGTGLDV